MSGEPIDLQAKAREYHELQRLDFDQFVLTESAESMEAKMLAQKFVLGRIAILGQWTVLYGGPNVGKTLLVLFQLVQQILKGEIDPKSVFYINADDTYAGMVEKQRIAMGYGFNMLVPGMQGFKATMLLTILSKRVESGTAKGAIVILDTMKKFTDLMSKKAGAEFGDAVRVFVAAGGTVISLGHVNKHKNDDGESIYAGTSDIVDDADCAYLIDLVEDNGQFRTVKFRNIKARGDVAPTAQYSYRTKSGIESMTYRELFDSVREISDQDVQKALERSRLNQRLEEHAEAILAIQDAIRGGTTLKSAILSVVSDNTAIGRRQVNKVLKEHTGTDWHKGHRWTYTVGENNSYTYRLLGGG